ncbi:MAG: choice-of-anchor U domain-containing protein [Rhodoferax sp.]
MKCSFPVRTSRAMPGARGFRARARMTLAAASLALGGLFAMPLQAQATLLEPTDANVAAAIAGGQEYLFNQFTETGGGTGGYWNDPSYGGLTATATAVAALVESGMMKDAAYKDRIEKGIAYIKDQVKTDGGIYTSHHAYETGLALVALGLYGQATTTDAAYKTIVRNAVDFLKSYQNIEGSTRGGDYGPNGEATSTNTTACGPSYKPYYGGWGYYPGNSNAGNKCIGGGDLSNAQFVVMGLWYGSRYLGDAIDTAPWAKAVLYFLKSQQSANGGFTVYAGEGNDYPTVTGTASGLWILSMIGQKDTAKRLATDTKTMAQNAIDWYGEASNYTWTYSGSYTYFIYGMAKALTATVGPGALIGTHDWAADMKSEVINSVHRVHTDAVTGGAAATDSWAGYTGLDPDTVGKTSWVLMSLAFASTSTESTEKLLAQEDGLDNVVKGLLTLHTTDGVTISAAGRSNVAAANLGQNVVLPIGAVSFTLNNVLPVGGTAVLSIAPPAGALDPTNANSFVNADGTTLKAGLSWFKITGGAWQGLSSVPITVDLAKGVILVTLKDGGPEDADGVADGKIVDPGAPGYGVDAAAVVTSSDSDNDWFGCSVGNGRPDPTLLILLAGGVAYLVRRRRP